MHLGSYFLKSLGFVLVAGSVLFGSFDAEAARVTKVKGKQVLVDFAGSDLQVEQGKKYFILIDGKKAGIVQITQIKGTKAIGTLSKGRAVVNAPLEAPAGSTSRAQNSRSSKSSGAVGAYSLGVLGSLNMNSQSVVLEKTSETVPMSGMSFSFKAYSDLPIMDSIGLIGRVGVTQFSAEGKSKTQDELTSITYLAADLLLRYNFLEGDFVPFAAAGLGLHFPLSKESTILDVTQIASTTIFYFGGGLHYNLSPTMFLTAMAEYGLFPPSNTVSTSLISASAGVALRF